jgi:hypothetical protein
MKGMNSGAELSCSEEVTKLEDLGVCGLQSSYPARWMRMTFSLNFPTGGVDRIWMGEGRSTNSIACLALATKSQYSTARGIMPGFSIHTQQVRN